MPKWFCPFSVVPTMVKDSIFSALGGGRYSYGSQPEESSLFGDVHISLEICLSQYKVDMFGSKSCCRV